MRFIIAFLILTLGLHADFSKAEELISKLEEEYGIEIVYKKKEKLTWRLKYKIADENDAEKFAEYVEVLDEEIRKYPKSFVKLTKLKKIFLVKNLYLSSQYRAAVPDYAKEILVLDFAVKDDGDYRKHVIHHEYYHMIEQEFNRSAYYKDKEWAKLNSSKFKYGKGGKFNRGEDMFPLTNPEKGFINKYSMTALEEDKAEIFAILFVKEEYEKVSKFRDSIIRQKIEYMKKFLESKDKSFDTSFWQDLHEDEDDLNDDTIESGRRKKDRDDSRRRK